MSETEDVKKLRDMVWRARRLAVGLSTQADRDRLLRHAEDLELQAMELEQSALQGGLLPKASAQIAQVQVQVQQQQQHETGPPASRPEPKKPS